MTGLWRSPVALAGVVLLAGVGARLAVLPTLGAPPLLQGDEVYYVDAAQSLVRGDGYPGSARPPAWPFLLSLVWRALGGEPNLPLGRLVQSGLLLLAALLVFDWARRAYGPRAGVVSGVLCAVHPTLVHYGLFFWSEPLYIALLVLAFWSLHRHHTGHAGWLGLAGVAFGLAALTREVVLYFVPLVVLWLWTRPASRHRGRWQPGGLLLGGVLVTVLPWTARNYSLQGRVVLVSTIRWLPVAQGNLLPEKSLFLGPVSDATLVERYLAIADEREREQYARSVALQAVAREQPAWILRKMVRNSYQLFRPRGQLEKFLRAGWLAPGARDPASRLVAVEASFYVVSMVLAIIALWRVRADPLKCLVVAYFLFTWGLHVLANANHRFRVPLLPFLALYTGPLITRELGPSGRHRALGMALSLLTFAAVVGLDLLREQ
ncbi:MAG TPA: glycosyltransferase family 39 protein [Vicinamibacteria bacterium]|nr:glycosyltransferase family 39 protein [Vicinamibacteria bacterium]